MTTAEGDPGNKRELVSYQEYQRFIDTIIEETGTRMIEPYSEEEAASLEMLGERNFVGFGFGAKMVGGKQCFDLEASIVAYVVRKVPSGQVEEGYLFEDLVKRILNREASTDVIEAGRPQAF